MQLVADWLKANWPWLAPVLALVLTNVANGLVKYPTADTVLHMLADWVSVTVKKDSPGTFKLPFTRSQRPLNCVDSEVTTLMKVPPAMAVLPLVFALGFSSCATAGGKALTGCEAGKVPQIEQAALVAVTEALSDPTNWEADLIQIGATCAPGQLECLITAAIAELRGQPATMGSSQRAQMIARGEAWLAAHKAKASACRDVKPENIFISNPPLDFGGSIVLGPAYPLWSSGNTISFSPSILVFPPEPPEPPRALRSRTSPEFAKQLLDGGVL